MCNITPQNIVLIADRTHSKIEKMDSQSKKLEKIDDDYFYELYYGLEKIYKKVIHYNSPDSFQSKIHQHKNDLIFTIYGGETSRNRMALIPSICEASKVKYVGADTYQRILCQDKYLSKLFIKEMDFLTPTSILLRNKERLNDLEYLNFPIVLKPNLEGSSIGISKQNLVYNLNEAMDLTEDLLRLHRQDILAEEFIPGKEVSICILGNSNKTKIEVVEIYFENNQNYFNSNLFTAEEKCNRSSDRAIRLATHLFHSQYLNKFLLLYNSMGKMDYMRIDGKVLNGKFYFIEFTPDAHLGFNTHFATAFKLKGYKYEEILKEIINSSLRYYQNQYANDLKMQSNI